MKRALLVVAVLALPTASAALATKPGRARRSCNAAANRAEAVFAARGSLD